VDTRTAYKLFIRDVTERTLNKAEDGPSYIEYNDQPISTVRVMGVVVSRYDSERYTILTVDDSTETISVRAFGDDKDMLGGVAVGDTLDVIGVLREYEEETYIAPRSVWKVEDPNWEIVRNLELLIRSKETGVGVSHEEVLDQEEVEESDLKPTVLNLIKKFDAGDGTDYNTLLKESGLSESLLDSTLNDLLSDSDVYEPKIGKFKKV
jgi:RPA family protein